MLWVYHIVKRALEGLLTIDPFPASLKACAQCIGAQSGMAKAIANHLKTKATLKAIGRNESEAEDVRTATQETES